ncbi:MAG: hypothetical protein CVT94_01315 [Bacteroidetes bacterium HGW-Bacteroidetes-11]|nr:MAG: hypothetical protein CVT94_01315 [Bacteroidetes bacterium HGW-Bacteroidetes-11]
MLYVWIISSKSNIKRFIGQFANNSITIPKITKKAKRCLRITKNFYFCHSINIVACLSVANQNI